MKTALTSLALTVLLCACTPGNDIGDAAPGDDAAGNDAPGETPADGAAAYDVPERYRGEWAATAEACDRQGEVTQLVIDDDSIQFHESEGPIVSLVERGSELTVLARLTGEGETRDASYTFRLSADGNTLTDLNGFARQRCD
jgi:hypothetical protein